MSRQSLRPYVDRLLGGGLDRYLADHRAAGTSFEDIARDLENTHGVKVSGETVRNWFSAEPSETVA